MRWMWRIKDEEEARILLVVWLDLLCGWWWYLLTRGKLREEKIGNGLKNQDFRLGYVGFICLLDNQVEISSKQLTI